MIDDSDLGGEPACWAHLVDDLDDGSREGPGHSTWVDLGDLTSASGEGSGGVVWSLPHGGDLDGNAVWLHPDGSIDEHVNDEVDVLMVVWSGQGTLTSDGRSMMLRPGVVAEVERGACRSIRAGSDGIVYLSIHRRRDGPTITRR